MSPTESGRSSAAHGRGLAAVFGSTLFQLSGIFMLSPLLLLILKSAQVSSSVAGLFAATSWLGIFIMTPFASLVTKKVGSRNTMWLASVLPLLAVLGFLATDNLGVWFLMELMAGVAGGLRWVLAEAYIAEFAPSNQRGRYIGAYATMVGVTFIIGPALLAWIGTDGPHALWAVMALLLVGLAWTALIPASGPDHDEQTAQVGTRGLWSALVQHPIIMIAGFTGGFFELGLASILPLYGLALGLSAAQAALLVSVSGAGGTLAALPAGMLADRFESPAQGRRTMMRVCAALILLSACGAPFVVERPWLLWPMVCIWGAAGGALYTLAMIDIGTREQGITLVNSTSVLVLTYTMGGLVASAISGVFIDWSVAFGFPVLLIAVAGAGLAALRRPRSAGSI